MSRRSSARPPLEREAVMDDLREVLMSVGCQIALTTGSTDLAAQYTGTDLEDFSLVDDASRAARKIDLDRFPIARQVSDAFDFAVQTGDPQARIAFGEDDWHDLALLKDGGPRCGFGGNVTPVHDEDSQLRRVLDMAFARMTLRHGGALTIRELALLADIGETAVRTSLSGEGIRTEGKPAKVDAALAEPWLLRRRGYVPTLEAAVDAGGADIAGWASDLPIADAVKTVMAHRAINVGELAAEAGVAPDWLGGLAEGAPIDCDIDALRRLANWFETDAPPFVGRAVTDILKRQTA